MVEDVEVRRGLLTLLGCSKLDHVLLDPLDVAPAVRVAVDLLCEARCRDAERIGVLSEDRVDVAHLVEVRAQVARNAVRLYDADQFGEPRMQEGLGPVEEAHARYFTLGLRLRDDSGQQRRLHEACGKPHIARVAYWARWAPEVTRPEDVDVEEEAGHEAKGRQKYSVGDGYTQRRPLRVRLRPTRPRPAVSTRATAARARVL